VLHGLFGCETHKAACDVMTSAQDQESAAAAATNGTIKLTSNAFGSLTGRHHTRSRNTCMLTINYKYTLLMPIY